MSFIDMYNTNLFLWADYAYIEESFKIMATGFVLFAFVSAYLKTDVNQLELS